jgi:hypothetical protein
MRLRCPRGRRNHFATDGAPAANAESAAAERFLDLSETDQNNAWIEYAMFPLAMTLLEVFMGLSLSDQPCRVAALQGLYTERCKTLLPSERSVIGFLFEIIKRGDEDVRAEMKEEHQDSRDWQHPISQQVRVELVRIRGGVSKSHNLQQNLLDSLRHMTRVRLESPAAEADKGLPPIPSLSQLEQYLTAHTTAAGTAGIIPRMTALGFAVVPMPGDGDCIFSAFIHQLLHVIPPPQAAEIMGEHREKLQGSDGVQVLRDLCCSWLRKNPAYWSLHNIFTANELEAFSKAGVFDSPVGDHVPQALASLFRVTIEVYQGLSPESDTLVNPIDALNQAVIIRVLRTSRPAHYDSLRLIASSQANVIASGVRVSAAGGGGNAAGGVGDGGGGNGGPSGSTVVASARNCGTTASIAPNSSGGMTSVTHQPQGSLNDPMNNLIAHHLANGGTTQMTLSPSPRVPTSSPQLGLPSSPDSMASPSVIPPPPSPATQAPRYTSPAPTAHTQPTRMDLDG